MIRTGLRPLSAALAVAGLFVSGCSTAIAGEATAPPGVPPSAIPGSTKARLVLPDPPPWTPPARVRELPEIVTSQVGATR
ncbi:hypothetical protein MFAL_29110 [Mycolicibacterium fallax]|nr:hypothetical protein MFAL_29110 [Mycolicibacterium fallax]